MKTYLAVLSMLLGLGAPPTAAAEVFPRYAESVWLNIDGSAQVDVEVDCPAGTNAPVRLPLAAQLSGLTISGMERATASITRDGTQRYISIDFPGPLATTVALRASGTVHDWFTGMKTAPKAFGNRTLAYRFLNSTPVEFGTVFNQVVLPPGFVVTSIEDSDPPASESNTMPPFAVVSRDGRHAVSVTATHVGLGGTATVTFRFKERTVSPFVAIALTAVGAAYLVGFRSLISAPDAHP